MIAEYSRTPHHYFGLTNLSYMGTGFPVKDAVRQVLACYPRIYFACHARHRHDPETRAKITAHQASILDHLDTAEITTLKDLAQHMGVTAATMSVTVDRLSRAGYVLRKRDAKDGRRVSLRLSAAGARMKQAQQVLEPARVEAMLKRLSPAEGAEALSGLALLARAASEEIASWSGTKR
jgi:DNA-binding MarR family transcriptional regulator